MMDNLKKYNLIKELLHGFLKHPSLTNLLECLEILTNYIDQGYLIDVIYLDFQKAFDRMMISEVSQLAVFFLNCLRWLS